MGRIETETQREEQVSQGAESGRDSNKTTSKNHIAIIEDSKPVKYWRTDFPGLPNPNMWIKKQGSLPDACLSEGLLYLLYIQGNF